MRSISVRLVLAYFLLSVLFISGLAQTKAFDTSRMDTTAEACMDFFQYANGNWVKNTPIPPSEFTWGTFGILRENNALSLKKILENAAQTKTAPGSNLRLIGDFYAACTDETAIERSGLKLLEPYFKKIATIHNVKDLENQIATFHSMGIDAVFGFGVGPDAKNSSINIISVRQGGLTLPFKDYYIKDDSKSVEMRARFVEYMTNMFKLLGEDSDRAIANAKTVMAIQTRLAGAAKSSAELRDMEANYNKRSLTQLAALTPNFSWTNYLTARGISTVTDINVGQPDFFVEMNKMITEVPVAEWKIYLRWLLINSSAPSLPKAFADENFNFFGKYFSGTKEQQPRWKRCVDLTDSSLGEALGQEYIKENFTPEAKKGMNRLIDNLFTAYRERINDLDWMSAETKQKALAKLSAFKRKIGYPDILRGYKGLTISRKSHWENSRNITKFQINRNLQDIDKPVDQTRWRFTPPTVNANYSAPTNTITFPAGILQPPFFNFAADDAINYGAIGAVIGHEITHGFDDQGSKYDADGNLKSWWTEADRAKFEDRVACVTNQFNGYEVQKDLYINGKLTLGENVADLGGLTMAYTALLKAMEGKPPPAAIDGFTPEQRFFLGWAQIWAGKYTEEAERGQILGNPHALPRWRVNGPLSNLPQFAKAFGCRSDQNMVRRDVCRIW